MSAGGIFPPPPRSYTRDPKFDDAATPDDVRRRQRDNREEDTMRGFVTAGVTVFVLSFWGCGGSGYSSGSGATPNTPTPSTTAGAVTINVVAINGAQSFSPNPATLPAGQLVVWHNVDTITHRVVLNDRSVDTGDLAPGASSEPIAIGSAGGQYHCSIHPAMIGSLNQSTSSPGCQGAYCN
jgi:plastocyanin